MTESNVVIAELTGSGKMIDMKVRFKKKQHEFMQKLLNSVHGVHLTDFRCKGSKIVKGKFILNMNGDVELHYEHRDGHHYYEIVEVD